MVDAGGFGLDGGFDRAFLHFADERAAEDADGQHADACDGIEGERAAFGGLFGDDAQHGRPEEGFADAVEGRGEEDEGEALGC